MDIKKHYEEAIEAGKNEIAKFLSNNIKDRLCMFIENHDMNTNISNNVNIIMTLYLIEKCIDTGISIKDLVLILEKKPGS